MDADGYFYLVDRKKDMIISGGFNVYPQMIEQAIYDTSRRARGDRDRHSRRLSRRGGQGVRQTARRSKAVHAGGIEGVPRRQARQARDCRRRSNSSRNCRAPRSANSRAMNCATSSRPRRNSRNSHREAVCDWRSALTPRRPGESRDPYAGDLVLKRAGRRLCQTRRPVVMGPGFRRDDERQNA